MIFIKYSLHYYFIYFSGRDGTLVSSGLPWCGDEETEIRKQKAEEFMNNPETRAMFMERKTEGYFDEGPMGKLYFVY